MLLLEASQCPPLPHRSLPGGVLLLRGDFVELDEWLEHRDADPYRVSGLPSLAELSRAGEAEIVTQVRHGHLRGPRKLRELLNTCQVLESLLPEHARSAQSCRSAAGSKAEADDWPPLRTCGTFVFPKGVEQSFCAAEKGYLDLFSGCCGVARELARLTGRWVLCYDIKFSDSQDLSSTAVQHEIFQLLESGWILGGSCVLVVLTGIDIGVQFCALSRRTARVAQCSTC